MRRHMWVLAFAVALLTSSQGLGTEPGCCEPSLDGFLSRIGPLGGWHPYGGGLLHWWPPHCFPCCGAPDDYCRKPLPRVCWPPYPAYYQWGPPELGCQPSNGSGACNKPE